MGDSRKLVVALLILAILFSVVSIIISMSSDVSVEVPSQGVNVVKAVENGGSGVGLVIERGGAG